MANHHISREDYLKRILLHHRRTGRDMTMGELAESVGVAGASATGMVKTLVSQGWLEYMPHKGVRLTESGHQTATQILRRHRLIELFLVTTLHIDWSEVHDEAETIEHAISDKLLGHIDAFLGHPAFDPHGDPIPNAQGQFPEPNTQPVTNCDTGQPRTVRRITDQTTGFLKLIEQLGLKPGSQVTLVRIDPNAQIAVLRDSAGAETALALTAAAHVLVDEQSTPDPTPTRDRAKPAPPRPRGRSRK